MVRFIGSFQSNNNVAIKRAPCNIRAGARLSLSDKRKGPMANHETPWSFATLRRRSYG